MAKQDQAVVETPKQRRRRRFRAWLGRLIVAFFLFLLVLTVAFVVALNSPAFLRLAVKHGLPRANEALPGSISIGSVEGAIANRIVLNDVVLLDELGIEAVSVPRIELDWSWWDLFGRRIELHRVRVIEPEVTVNWRQDKSIGLLAAFMEPKSAEEKARLRAEREAKTGTGIVIVASDIDSYGGHLVLNLRGGATLEFDDVEAFGSWSMGRGYQDVAIERLETSFVRPLALPDIVVSGGLRVVGPDLHLDDADVKWRGLDANVSGSMGTFGGFVPDLDVLLRSFDLTDLEALIEGSPAVGTVSGQLAVGGRLRDDITIEGPLRLGDGGQLDIHRLELGIPSKVRAVLSYGVDVSFVDLSPDYLLPKMQILPDDLRGRLVADGEGLKADALNVDVKLDAEPFELLDLELGPVSLDASADGFAITARSVDVGLLGGDLHVSGGADLTLRSFSADFDGALARLGDLSELSGGVLKRGSAELDGVATGSWGGDGPHPLQLHAEVGLQGRRLDVAGVGLGEADVVAEVDVDLVRGGIPELRGPVHVVVDRVQLKGKEQVKLARLGVDLQTDRAEASLHAERGDDIQLDFAGLVDWGSLPTLEVFGDSLEAVAAGQTITSERRFSFELRQKTFQLDQVELQTAGGRILAQASSNPHTGALDGLVRVRGLDLTKIEPSVFDLLNKGGEATDLGLEGVVRDLTLKASGTLADPVLLVRSELRDVTAMGRPSQDLDLQLDASEGVLSGSLVVPALLEAQIRRVPLRLGLGGGPVAVLDPDGDWDLELTLPERPLADLAELADFELPEELAGSDESGKLTWTGTTADPVVSLRVGLSGVRVEDRKVGITLGAKLADGVLDPSTTRIRTDVDGTLAQLTGATGLPLGELLVGRLGPPEARSTEPIPLLREIRLGAEIKPTKMALIHSVVPATRPLTGAISADLAVAGELSAPELDATLHLVGARVGRHVLKPVDLVVGLHDGSATLAAAIEPALGGHMGLDVSVSLPLSLAPMTPTAELLGQPDLDVEVAGEGFPIPVLLAFFPDQVWESSGALTLTGTVTGSLKKPTPDLKLVIGDSRVCVSPTGVCYEKLDLDVLYDLRGIALNNLSLETQAQRISQFDLNSRQPLLAKRGREGLKATGRVGMEGLVPSSVTLDVEFEDAWLMHRRGIEAQVDGSLAVRGTLPALDITGKLELVDVNVLLGNEDLGARKTQALKLPRNLRVHRVETARKPGERPQHKAVAADTKPGLGARIAAASTADVQVQLGSRVDVALNYGIAGVSEWGQALNLLGNIRPALKLGGAARVRYARKKVSLEGEVATLEGSKVHVFNRPFDVSTDSRVTFVGALMDTQLDVKAGYVTSASTVQVLVTERLGSPHIEFRSDDDTLDETDIMAILLTGKSMSELSAGEGAGTVAAVVGGLSGFTTAAFGDYIPVERLSVDLGDDIRTGSVEAGKAITERIFLLVLYRWGADEDENRVEGQVEARIGSKGYVEFRLGDRLIGSAELVFKSVF